MSEVKLFPISEAFMRKSFFLNNSELRLLNESEEFKSWYLSTFGENYPNY